VDTNVLLLCLDHPPWLQNLLQIQNFPVADANFSLVHFFHQSRLIIIGGLLGVLNTFKVFTLLNFTIFVTI